MNNVLSRSGLYSLVEPYIADRYGAAEKIYVSCSQAVLPMDLNRVDATITCTKGQFRNSGATSTGRQALSTIGATKWCVFEHIEATRWTIEAVVAERLHFMQATSIDLLQVRSVASRNCTIFSWD